MRRRPAPLLVALLLAGCASSGVQVARSDQHPPNTTGTTTSSTDPAGTTTPGSGPVSTGTIAWSACDDYDAPYQCGTISVPLDYDHTDGTQISLALIRLPAADPGQRIGSLLVNPGGPGGSGIDLAYNEGDDFPQSVLDHFDIVGFDPRGVGASAALTCPAASVPSSGSYDACIDPNIDVLPYLGTPNVARDMDSIRAAVGDAQLTYLGFSYGTALGAVYADLFPDRVRAMVLDGSVDPDAGISNTPEGGSDFYADQDFDGTIAVFEKLCDASTACAAGPDSHALLNRVRHDIRDLPTTEFPSGGHLTRTDVDDLMVNAMYSAFDWPLLGIALKDADDGDASTLSALYSYLLYGFPADHMAEDDEDFSNIAIRCADFADRGPQSFECQHFPKSADSLPIIQPVDTPTPVLVVGTKDDPATPAHYAKAMAKSLGDAVAIEWEGAGHTATLTSQCITDIVADYLVDTTVPKDGTTCPFATGATTTAQEADAVFTHADPEDSADAVSDVLVGAGDPADVADCVAKRLVAQGDMRLVVHELLGVESPELTALRSLLEARCRGGG
ncbi:MAG: hypothetical protein JWM34_1243 [Ilumatobacteraceae bacterium]|nr:hypothetical protein [Ilumatobacteraceae bacterium]